MTAVTPLFPRVRALPGDDTSPERHGVPAGTLFLAPATLPTAALVERALIDRCGEMPSHWRLLHDRTGAPTIRGDGAPAVSVAATGRTRAVLLGRRPLGIDVETLDRVDLNATVDDDWLSADERALLNALADAARTLELACRWVLREAIGKASGRGLDLPLARLAFTMGAGGIALPPAVVPGAWTFSLHRRRDLVVGIASGG